MALQAIGLGFESPYLHIHHTREAFFPAAVRNRAWLGQNEMITGAGRGNAWCAFDDGSLTVVCWR